MKWIAPCLFFLLIPIKLLAAVPTWQIILDQSSITFTATQNGSPVTGKFKTFSGHIQFDPQQLKESSVNIIVDTSSVSTSYNQVAETLMTPDWFNIKIFPQAIFKSTEFTTLGTNDYQTKGNLTIRDKTQPVTFTLTVTQQTANKAQVKGHLSIKRTDFNVGQGDWANTDQIKDIVQIDFILTANKLSK